MLSMELLLTLSLAVLISSVNSKSLQVPDDGRLIVGGKNAKIGEIPYILSLRKDGNHFCGASLIGPGKALTAAHCVDGLQAKDITVVAGTIRSDKVDMKSQTRSVKKITTHPGYNPNTHANDIALIFVLSDFEINSNVATIPIRAQHTQTYGDLLVSGWGVRFPGGQLMNVLQKVVVPFVSDAKCRENYPGGRILDAMLCAGFDEGGKDSCYGDSGGPLVSTGTKELAGIVSWGEGCARPNKPGVYTEVSYYTDWINAQEL